MVTRQPSSAGESVSSLRQTDLLRFWLPLWASWLLMTGEGPFLTAVVNRLPGEVVMLAALGIVISLAVTIESPIINLLATTTALVRDHDSYLLLRRFTIHWMFTLTGVGILLAFTPLFDLVVRDLLATPEEIARWVQPGLQMLVLWSPAIAWRRFLQGVMIHFQETDRIAWGTVLRLVISVSTALSLVQFSSLSGIHIAASAMLTGTFAEAFFITWAVRRVLAEHLAPGIAAAERAEDEDQPLTYRRLASFHLPLAATGVLTLMTQPMVAFTLARLDRPTQTLAAWPLIFWVTLVARSVALSLPEVVIAKLNLGKQALPALRRFTITLALLVLAAMALLILTPLLTWYLARIQDTTPELAVLAREGLLLLVPMPALAVLAHGVQGVLIQRRATRTVNLAMVGMLITQALVLGVGLRFSWPGLTTAALALDVSMLFMLIFLLVRMRREMIHER